MFKNIYLLFIFFTLMCLSLVPISSFAESVTIDFESFPSGTGVLKDDVAVSNQYKDAYGITLSIDQDKNTNTTKDRAKPTIEQRGKQRKGAHGFFYNKGRVYDSEADKYQGQLGNFFLKFKAKTSAKSNLLIELSRPATSVSGVLWDIDATSVKSYEQWKIVAYTRQNYTYKPIGSMDSPKGLPFKKADTLDGRPYAWTLDSSKVSGDIYAVLITFTGSKRNGFDVGFDQLTVMFKEEDVTLAEPETSQALPEMTNSPTPVTGDMPESMLPPASGGNPEPEPTMPQPVEPMMQRLSAPQTEPKIPDSQPVPEPGTMLLVGGGLLGLFAIMRRKYRK